MASVVRLPPSFLLSGALLAAALTTGVLAQSGKPAAGASPQRKPAETAATPSPGAGPVVVVDTVKGAFEFETYPEDAPKSVEHVLGLVRRNFYNGLRVHRVEPGFVVQFGDPRTRDMTKRDEWGRAAGGGSGRPVGAAEFSKKRLHVRGAVAMAHAGDPAQADSQIYVLLGTRPALDGKYAVIGKVLSGMDVVEKLEVTDIIRRMSIKGAGAAPKK
jgi:cyclophilin family peptidyl-prolyl cis-trans isomerase